MVAANMKTIETRSWRVSHRGPLGIQAAKRRAGANGGWGLVRGLSEPQWQRLSDHLAHYPSRLHVPGGLVDPESADSYPLGCVVATCLLTDCLPIMGSRDHLWPDRHLRVENGTLRLWHNQQLIRDFSAQLPFGDFTPGRFGWMLREVRPVVPPLPAKGAQGLWDLPFDAVQFTSSVERNGGTLDRLCWFGDGPATREYWFELRREWRPLCDGHELIARDNLPSHYIRDMQCAALGALPREGEV